MISIVVGTYIANKELQAYVSLKTDKRNIVIKKETTKQEYYKYEIKRLDTEIESTKLERAISSKRL